ncbi:hypothetical protein LTR09_006421 [Extremus antarcticus]|uniref:Uncharacterized protein n=1 Tax=Extremus antarcticus TaxID=702011 RepID=A0AAJ0DL72_9PEZI|nr:hypothetical protein LTR09_006421 [Extremus antarcticus]
MLWNRKTSIPEHHNNQLAQTNNHESREINCHRLRPHASNARKANGLRPLYVPDRETEHPVITLQTPPALNTSTMLSYRGLRQYKPPVPLMRRLFGTYTQRQPQFQPPRSRATSDRYSQLQSPLFRLPFELRMQIYFLVLDTDDRPLILDPFPFASPLNLVCAVWQARYPSLQNYQNPMTSCPATVLAILCHRARNELKDHPRFFFAATELAFTNLPAAKEYLDSVPPKYRRLITSLTFIAPPMALGAEWDPGSYLFNHPPTGKIQIDIQPGAGPSHLDFYKSGYYPYTERPPVIFRLKTPHLERIVFDFRHLPFRNLTRPKDVKDYARRRVKELKGPRVVAPKPRHAVVQAVQGEGPIEVHRVPRALWLNDHRLRAFMYMEISLQNALLA